MSDHHVTLPTCPSCGAPHKAVGHWLSTEPPRLEFFCFACRAEGTTSLDYSITRAPELPAA